MCRAVALVLALLVAVTCDTGEEQAANALPTVHLRQSGEADRIGDDDVAIKTAIESLRATGGTLVLGPGRYVMRRQVFAPAGVTLRGEAGAVLALPSPVVLAEPAAAGTNGVVVAGAHEFVGESRVQILPPVESEFFSDGVTKTLELQRVGRVEGQTLTLVDPLPFDLPAGCRLGYPHKLFWVAEGHATFEDLAFEGGRVDAIPMPGHSQRCAIWAAAPFGYDEKRLADPGSGVVVRRCRFSDWYGRGVAFYNQVDGAVEDSLFERIHDEAIDLDHYVERFHIAGNTVRDALWGIVLNDASRNVVEKNVIDGCDIGIWSWWYDKIPRNGVNEENVIRGNVVRRARQHAILIDKTCVRYVIEDNEVEGSIQVVEPENTLGRNKQL